MQLSSILRSINSLSEQTDLLLKAFQYRSWRLSDFVQSNNFDDYWKFYKEMASFFSVHTKDLTSPEIKNLIGTFITNKAAMNKILDERKSYSFFSSWLFDSFFPGENTSDFEQCLKHISDNITNLQYHFKINS